MMPYTLDHYRTTGVYLLEPHEVGGIFGLFVLWIWGAVTGIRGWGPTYHTSSNAAEIQL